MSIEDMEFVSLFEDRTMIRLLLITSLIAFSGLLHAASDDVAKAIIVRGKALAQSPDGKVLQVTKGMWFKEGTQIRTEDKSFVKLIFIDKSQMNLGPSSQMKIDKFPQNDPGIVTLVKGQLRSKVTKNYMDMDNKDKSKLFIKTKTAAMGVRGTDFQVNYNPENNFTSLVTFEGAVAMASLDVLDGRSPAALIDQSALERIVSSNQAVTVTRGQFSGASPETGEATIPVKINPIQLESMEKDESGTTEAAPVVDTAKPARSIVPPGVNGAAFSNKPKVETQVDSSVANKAAQKSSSLGSDAGGRTNSAASGAVVDVATGKLLLPPKNSAIDTNTGVPILAGATNVLIGGGKVDMSAISTIQTVIVELKAANDVAKIEEVNRLRSPAGVDGGGTAPTNPLTNAPPPTAALPQDPVPYYDPLEDPYINLADAQDLGTSASSTTRVNLNFNVQ